LQLRDRETERQRGRDKEREVGGGVCMMWHVKQGWVYFVTCRDLSYNSITSVTSGSFNGLSGLETLYE
jgi:hypothetical protein